MTQHSVVYVNADGVRRTVITDTETGAIHFQAEVDVTQALENNAILRELHPRRSTNKLVARGVPLTVAEQAMREQWDDNDWKRWLNDPANAAFRVWQGRV